MATTRLLRTSSPINQIPSSSTTTTTLFMRGVVRCQSRVNLNGDHNIASGKGERKAPVMAVKELAAATDIIATSQPVIRQGLLDLAMFITRIRNAMLVFLRASINGKQWNLPPQMLIERAIIDFRFFTLFAVAGSLLGSILCFVEGCFLVLKSYAHYFHTLSHSLDQGHLVHLLIEAIDMFLVGTALLIFGASLYVIFVGSATAEKESWPCGSNLLGLFYMKSAPGWVGMQSVAEAKSKIGYAVMMILQVGVLDKLKDISFVTGLDLAFFAAAVFTSSASIFVLSRLHR